jgi:hypothetical protein
MLEAISNRKGRFTIQKHQNFTAIFHQISSIQTNN